MSAVELSNGVVADEEAADNDHIPVAVATRKPLISPTKHTTPSIPNAHGIDFNLQTCVYLFIAVMIGVSTVVQGGVNIALAEWIGGPLKSGFLSFIIGTVCLSLTVCTPSTVSTKSMIGNIVTECRLDRRNLFIFLNGLLGVIFLCSAIYIAPVIGYGLYAISLVFGQIISSTLIDHYGLIWSSKRKLSTVNLCGPILAICGDVLFQIPSFTQSEGMNPR